MSGDLSELLFLAIGWFGWKSAATAFFASVVLLFILNVRSEVDPKTSYRTVLARRRANPQEMEYTLAITTGFFLFMIVIPVVADMLARDVTSACGEVAHYLNLGFQELLSVDSKERGPFISMCLSLGVTG
ncbi:hypothetical protein FRC12_016303 [Ceratobasidium sp. 428]|nr:hypothetical protein FRC12_016303 [Ceratobasidium sp. 428]